MSNSLYFQSGEVVASSGNVKVYKFNNELLLEIGPGHNLWALESEVSDYLQQLWDYPKGKCLEIGLGMGIASRVILSNPSVDSLTTVELREDIIKTHEAICPLLDDGSRDDKWLRYNKEKHRIVNCEGLSYLYQTKRKYDFVFLDFYSHIDDDTLPQIRDMVNAAKNVLNEGGKILCWLDIYTPDKYVEPFYDLFGSYLKEGRYIYE